MCRHKERLHIGKGGYSEERDSVNFITLSNALLVVLKFGLSKTKPQCDVLEQRSINDIKFNNNIFFSVLWFN